MSIRENLFLLVSFVILTVLYTIFSLQSNVFIAARVMKYSFLQNLLFNLLRTPLPLFFVAFGVLGIVSSWTIATAITFLIGSLWLVPKILPRYRLVPKINMRILKDIMPYSFGNYISGVLGSLPTMIMPLLIVNILEVENAAYFLVVWSITVIISSFPGAVTTSLFAEGSSNNEVEFRSNLIKSIKLIFFLLIPTILILFVFADKILLLFGQTYSQNATQLLGLFLIGCIPYAINQIYLTIKRVKMDIKPMIYVNLVIAIFVIGGSYLLMKTVGLMGIGIAWVIGQGVVAAIVCTILLSTYRTKLHK